MSGKEKLEAQLAALEALRQQPVEAAVVPLRAALKQRNNYLVAKAADDVRSVSGSSIAGICVPTSAGVGS